jgi:hypothetical protein
MPWRKGILDGYSSVVDVLPTTQERLPLVVVLPPALSLPVRHWTFKDDKHIPLGLLLMLKDWELTDILYIKSAGGLMKEPFGNLEEVSERMRQLGYEFPPDYHNARRRMQKDIDNGEISCWLTGSSIRCDSYGFRKLVPADEFGRKMPRRFITLRNGKAYGVTY